MSKTIKIGLVGCGDIARRVHLGILRRLPGAELAAIAEPDSCRRDEARSRAPAALTFEDYRELLAAPGIDAVVICVPNDLHVEVAVAAIRAGKHVYLEKPLATELEDGRRILDAWRAAGVVGMIGFNYRFNPLHQSARRQLRRNPIGPLVAARSIFSIAAQPLPPWKQSRQSGGGVLLDLASHHIDLVHFYFDRAVREVFATQQSQRHTNDAAMLEMRLDNGLLVQSFFSLGSVDEDRFEIYGQAGTLKVDRYRSWNAEIDAGPQRASRLRLTATWLTALAANPYPL
ncbi:MAG TPA: Gfo/Idh/MocA family oxidoreductase, partial [Ardenticatenaceae bacterium]|nr:Gfo/Idh/MocA family oxidoreductase [Ardenticatenaceae bacterium]